MKSLLPLALFALYWPAHAAANDELGELRLGEQHPLVMLVVRPGSSKAETNIDLFRAANTALAEHTGLKIERPEEAGIELSVIGGCSAAELLACYSRAIPDNARRRHLLVVTLFDGPNSSTNISSILIDLDAAKSARESIFGGDEDSKQRLEDQIFERTARATERAIDLRDQKVVAAYFAGIFDRDFRSMLESAGEIDPYGELKMEGAPAGLELELDGILIGRTTGKTIRILETRARKVKLALTDPQQHYAKLERDVELIRGEAVTVPVELVRLAEPGAGTAIRRAGFWSGIGLAVAGGALATYAIAASPNAELVQPCVGSGCSNSAGRFATFCQLARDRPSTCGDGGVLAAPLGMSLAISGGLWAVGSKLWGDETEIPWLPLIAGLAAGGATYALLAAGN